MQDAVNELSYILAELLVNPVYSQAGMYMPLESNAEGGELEKWAGHMLTLQQEGICLSKQNLSCCTNMQ